MRFCSIDRKRAKDLGINIADLGGGNTVGSVSTGTSPTLTTSSTTNSTTASFSDSYNILVQHPGNLPVSFDIKALLTEGLTEMLAEPNIVATNGKQASFLAGGEYPFPMVQGGTSGSAASVTIMFKEYGIKLNFIPTITPRGTIRLQVAPEVSSLDFSNEIVISGFTIPAISTRKMNTEVELGNGQSYVISGLLDNRETETFLKIPFLGDIPVLGKFFQSKSTNRTNTELIVIVTPQVVAPVAAGDPVPELKYPVKFLGHDNTIPMQQPETNAPATPPTPKTITVEKLIDSMKPETPLTEDSKGAAAAAPASSPTATGQQ